MQRCQRVWRFDFAQRLQCRAACAERFVFLCHSLQPRSNFRIVFEVSECGYNVVPDPRLGRHMQCFEQLFCSGERLALTE